MSKNLAILATSALVVAACTGGGDDNPGEPNVRPDFIKGTVVSTTFDGTSNDLLTAGLGKTGLGGAAPAVADPTNPTVTELRRVAIYNNYRALVDITANGGYGTLYGPNVDTFGTITTSEGKIAGEEHIVFADDGTGRENVTLMVQIPATFSLDRPCIITATSSGSRGIYGAIATAGEWGLKRGCAVAYTDKGSGNGGHDLANNAVYTMQGTRTAAGTAGTNSVFTANVSSADLAAFNAAFPNRWAYKHAHSQVNPEKDWGRDTLRAVQFAFFQLNQKYGTVKGGITYKNDQLSSDKTIVIASSASNGAGAAIAAAELDTAGLIDGVAVSEPQIFMNPPSGLTIKRGSTTVSTFGKTLYDYFTFADLYQPCAALSTAAASSPIGAGVLVNIAVATNRCAALAARGLVSGTTVTERANDAMARLLAYGWDADTTLFHASHYALATLSVTLSYANAYAKASVRDNLCGYSFGGTPAAGVPSQVPAAAAAQLFGTGNGVPPVSGVIQILNNNSVGGTALDAASISPSTGLPDYNVDGAACMRDLLTSTGTAGTTLRASIDAAKRTGNLRGKPVIIVHGRSDTLVPVNHTSRPYYALNKTVEGATSNLAYYEVTNAQHFDAFLPQPGYDSRLVPLHYYFNQAMNMMYERLKNGTALPASQVIHTTPRGGTPGAAPAIKLTNVPPIQVAPAATDQITFSNNTLTVPD